MKSEFKAKFLQHMINSRKSEKGFTLIELLVVIIIIGILAAIALPSFLNQAAKAKQSEAKSYVGAVNRAQQAYRIENASFAGAVTALEIGLSTGTATYNYTMNPTTGVSSSTIFVATPVDTTTLRGFAGGVIVLSSGQTEAVACQNKVVRGQASGDPVPSLNAAGGSTCGSNGEAMK